MREGPRASSPALHVLRGPVMRSGIEQARLELAKWEKRVAEDTAALAAAERWAAEVRETLAASTRAANSLRQAVQQWDAMQARHEPPNVGIERPGTGPLE